MLPLLHRQRYGELKQALEQAGQMLTGATYNGSDLRSKVTELQKFFQNQILGLDVDELGSEIEQRVQSYQVEMNKQLRLLGMDVVFLQAARQAATNEQRRNQVSDRLATLIRYCQVMVGEEVKDE